MGAWLDERRHRLALARGKAKWRLRATLRALVYDLDTRPVELLCAQISLWFAVVLLTSDSPNRPQPWWAWSGWCLVSAALKGAGVLPTLARVPPWWAAWLRGVGATMGLIFWIVLATVFFLLAGGGIVWGGYALLAAAQGWALYRLARRGA